MVDCTRTINNLIASVTVYVSYAEIVVALFEIIFVSGSICVEYPVFFQFLSIPVEGSQHDTGVVTATHHYARTDAIQIGY